MSYEPSVRAKQKCTFFLPFCYLNDRFQTHLPNRMLWRWMNVLSGWPCIVSSQWLPHAITVVSSLFPIRRYMDVTCWTRTYRASGAYAFRITSTRFTFIIICDVTRTLGLNENNPVFRCCLRRRTYYGRQRRRCKRNAMPNRSNHPLMVAIKTKEKKIISQIVLCCTARR